jgi:hypothetical protein
MNPELRDPVNAIGATLSVIGGVLMFTILFEYPERLMYTGLVLWAIGICILVIHSAHKKNQ